MINNNMNFIKMNLNQRQLIMMLHQRQQQQRYMNNESNDIVHKV